MNTKKDNQTNKLPYTEKQLQTAVEMIGAVSWHNLPEDDRTKKPRRNVLQIGLDAMFTAYSRENMLLEPSKEINSAVDLNESVIEVYYFMSKFIAKAIKMNFNIDFKD